MGGTSWSRKVPDMESLPPMAALPSSSWASSAPSRRGEGLAPSAAGSLPQLLKELLEGQIGLLIVRAGGDELGDRGVDRAVRARCRGRRSSASGSQPHGHDAALLGRIARQHAGSSAAIACDGAALRLAAEGHEHACPRRRWSRTAR